MGLALLILFGSLHAANENINKNIKIILTLFIIIPPYLDLTSIYLNIIVIINYLSN